MSQKTALVTMTVSARYIAEVPETDLPSILRNANQKMEDVNCVLFTTVTSRFSNDVGKSNP